MNSEKKCTCLVPLTPEVAKAIEVLERLDDSTAWDAAKVVKEHRCERHPRAEA